MGTSRSYMGEGGRKKGRQLRKLPSGRISVEQGTHSQRSTREGKCWLSKDTVEGHSEDSECMEPEPGL